MVVTHIVVVSAVGALRHGSATKFSPPEQQCVVQQSTLLEVCEKCGDRLVYLRCVLRMVALDVTMSIPLVTMGDLDEPNTSFGKASGH